jgi:hypothetical protein
MADESIGSIVFRPASA